MSEFVRTSTSKVRTHVPERRIYEIVVVVTTAGSPGRPCSIFEIVIWGIFFFLTELVTDGRAGGPCSPVPLGGVAYKLRRP